MEQENKYSHFSKNNNIVFYLDSLNDLKKYFLKICNKNYIESGQAESSFIRDMNKDGYIIIFHDDGEEIHYFIDNSKISNIFNDLVDQEEILNILKNRLEI